MTTIAQKRMPAPTKPALKPKAQMIDFLNQARELEHLKRATQGEFFFFISDWPSGQLSEKNGLRRWLGHSDDGFSATDFLNAQHASHLAATAAYFTAFGAILNEKPLRELSFLTPRLVFNQALRHRDGRWLLFKRTCSPWTLDEKRRSVVAFLNEFHLFGEFRGEALRPRLMAPPTEQMADFFEKISHSMQANFKKELPFTKRQLDILTVWATEQSLSEKQVGERLGVAGGTVHVHCRMILPIARAFFQRKFDSMRELVSWMRDSGMM